jgi:hypothetical protein
MPGAIIYRGPSQLDGAPIVAIAVWSSKNRKTGGMLQTYVLRSDIDPLLASKTGQDASICGACQHRGVPTDDPQRKQAAQRSCYVVLGQGPLQVYKAFIAGKYSDANNRAARAYLGQGRAVRIGTYGDGAAVPEDVWDDLLLHADTHTAYTHNGGHPGRYMISADTIHDAKAAWASKYRTFRIVRSTDEIVKGKEIECPSAKGVQCIDCRLCGGSAIQAKSIAIVVHGNGAVYF